MRGRVRGRRRPRGMRAAEGREQQAKASGSPAPAGEEAVSAAPGRAGVWRDTCRSLSQRCEKPRGADAKAFLGAPSPRRHFRSQG